MILSFEKSSLQLCNQKLPPPSDATTKRPCNEEEWTCGDGSCISNKKVCNFVYDCPADSSDEEMCPDIFTFNDCQEENDFVKGELGENISFKVGIYIVF